MQRGFVPGALLAQETLHRLASPATVLRALELFPQLRLRGYELPGIA